MPGAREEGKISPCPLRVRLLKTMVNVGVGEGGRFIGFYCPFCQEYAKQQIGGLCGSFAKRQVKKMNGHL